MHAAGGLDDSGEGNGRCVEGNQGQERGREMAAECGGHRGAVEHASIHITCRSHLHMGTVRHSQLRRVRCYSKSKPVNAHVNNWFPLPF